MDVDTSQLEQFFSQNFWLIVVVGGLLILAYGYTGRFVHTVVRRAMKTRDSEISESGVEMVEVNKRATTIESLATTLIRVTLISVGVFIFVGLTGWWSALLIIGLFFAALLFAGQAIVMDYLMGIIILLEGQYFQGDDIELGNPNWKGAVESVGLRRTVIRAVDGTVYSLSNGELRMVANRTRIYASSEVRIRGIKQGDLRRVGEIMDRVGKEVAEDPKFSDMVIEAPRLKFIDNPDELGSIAVMRGKIVANDRWRVATELRLRLDEALADEGIELNRQSLPSGLLGRLKG